ncbi:MAG TPA: nucleoside hydrolase [bacterium]|nr:nucleoside hydrolase [bacterium]HPO07279.1 nucleoside hydrolase [bacterium]HQO33091.1 nucleoside hydrolase [bacterium]HQP97240.1 nucleoside hydrolase [bacterium]
MKKIPILTLFSVMCCAFGLAETGLCAGTEEKMKIILDTDIGNDIDDAWALALSLVHPRFELLGVTTDYGNTPARAKLACKILHQTKQTHVPVAVGRQTNDHNDYQFTWAEDFNTYRPIETPAAQFLLDTVKKYPKQVTVIAVGPLPNLGDVLKMGPEFEDNVKEIILMSGNVYGSAWRPNEPIPEYNVVCDIEAAQRVYGSKVKLTIVPLDSTTLVRLKEEERKRVQKYQSPLTWSLECLLRLWTSNPDAQMTLHDQLAMAEAAEPGRFFNKKADLPVYVDDEGYTRVDEKKGRPITVCLEPKRDEFMEFYLSHLTSQRLGMD